ncbi:UNVERIFIED_CONTAM: hypothetical protein Cloal_2977 [Acetivibrio alkalicellulosi]
MIIKNKFLKISTITVLLLAVISVIVYASSFSKDSKPNDAYSSDEIKDTRISFATWWHYPDIQSLVDRADIIIVGESIGTDDPIKVFDKLIIPDDANEDMLKHFEEVKDEFYRIVTNSNVKVHKVIKGNIDEGSLIKINQNGGIYEGTQYIVDGIELFEKNLNTVFFLQDNSHNEVIPYCTLNPYDGHLYIKNGKTQPNLGSSALKGSFTECEIIELLTQKVKQSNENNTGTLSQKNP